MVLYSLPWTCSRYVSRSSCRLRATTCVRCTTKSRLEQRRRLGLPRRRGRRLPQRRPRGALLRQRVLPAPLQTRPSLPAPADAPRLAQPSWHHLSLHRLPRASAPVLPRVSASLPTQVRLVYRQWHRPLHRSMHQPPQQIQLCQCCQRTWGHWRSQQLSKVARQVVVAAMAWLLRARSQLIRTMNSKSRIGRRRHHPRMKRECRHCQCRRSGRPVCGRPSFERSLRSLVRLLLPLPRLLLSPPRPRACSRGRGHGHTRGPPLSPLRLLQRSLALQNRGRRHRSSALDHALPRQRVL
mmetsp:Transcript_20145/g.56169  ORF Transcript_20145/g.56169 Transcript_20145/m.56169 type:complete len:296 (-) Transcript_20145:2522-3409(-)